VIARGSGTSAPAAGPTVRTVETSTLGDRSYLAADGRTAVVIDPQRDVDRVIAEAGAQGVRIALVLETHVHNDYVSGGLELARLTGAEYGMAEADRVPFARALATPGHTFHHLSYALEGPAGPVGVFTGGSLLLGSTGRTDLLGREHTRELEQAGRVAVVVDAPFDTAEEAGVALAAPGAT
jgi:hydroxyacylglutathione hydrolase